MGRSELTHLAVLHHGDALRIDQALGQALWRPNDDVRTA